LEILTVNYHELETMLERLEEMRLALLQHDPTEKEKPSIDKAYTGISQAMLGIRNLLREEIAFGKLEVSVS
jgi:hypothetical protein